MNFNHIGRVLAVLVFSLLSGASDANAFWRTVKLKSRGVSVQLPNAPKESEAKLPNASKSITWKISTASDQRAHYTVAIASVKHVPDIEKFCREYFAKEREFHRVRLKDSEDPVLRATPFKVSVASSVIKKPKPEETYVSSFDVSAEINGIFGPPKLVQFGKIDIRVSLINEQVVVLHRFQFYGPFDDERSISKFLKSLELAD